MRLVLLGLPPSTNNLYAVVNGRQVLVEAGRSFGAAIRAVAARSWSGGPSEAAFAVMVTYHLGGHDRDVDGSHKPLLDALSGLVWRDDRQVVSLVLRKTRPTRRVLPYVSLVIRPLAARPGYRETRSPRSSAAFSTGILPPSTNNAYTLWRGRRRKTVLARRLTDAYREGFAALAGRAGPAEGALRIRLRFGYTADRRDVDGSHKLLLDAARGVLWEDDRQIVRLSLAKGRVAAATEARISGAIWELAA